MMSARLVGVAMVAGAMLWCAPALASRAATRSERIAIAEVMHLPAGCAVVRVSTERRGWAGFYGARTTRGCSRWASNGVTVLRRRQGRWRQVIAGSDLVCPIRRVPKAVAWDLDACWGERLTVSDARGWALDAAAPLAKQLASVFGVPEPTPKVDHCERLAVDEMNCFVNIDYDPGGVRATLVLCDFPEVHVRAELGGVYSVDVLQEFDQLGCLKMLRVPG
jgi:hypothetical protein